jgi:hypothetical protein
VEFVASRNGVPVFDLKPQDIALRVDNVEREVVALDLVRMSADASGMPPPFATNITTARGRDLLFVVDEQSFHAGGESLLRQALLELLQQMTPRDRVGLVSLHASGPSVATTSGSAAVRAAIQQIRGRAIETETATDLSCRTRRLLPVLASLMQDLEGGVRTTMVLFSSALAAPGPTAVPNRGVESACLLLPTDFDEFRTAASRSAAQLYAVHLADSSSTDQALKSGAGLERLAGENSGQFMRVTGDPAPQMKRIASETSRFYVAAVALEPGSRAGSRRVELRIRRDGVTARVKPALVVPPLESKTVAPRDMMRVSSEYRSLVLRAAGFSSRDTRDTAKVVVLFEPAESVVSLSAAMVGLFDTKGKLVAQWIAERPDLANRPVVAGLSVPPGSYRLRVAAVDSIGRSGAVDDELRVEIPAAGAVTTSGVIFGALTTSGFSPRLQFSSKELTAAVYLEVYGASPCSAVSAAFEIAAEEQSPALSKSTASAIPVEQSDACILLGGLDLSGLPPGDHAVRLQLQVNGEAAGQRLRTIRKSG